MVCFVTPNANTLLFAWCICCPKYLEKLPIKLLNYWCLFWNQPIVLFSAHQPAYQRALQQQLRRELGRQQSVLLREADREHQKFVLVCFDKFLENTKFVLLCVLFCFDSSALTCFLKTVLYHTQCFLDDHNSQSVLELSSNYQCQCYCN